MPITFQGVDPNSRLKASDFQKQLEGTIGRGLSQQEIAEGAQLGGVDQQGFLTGAGANRVLQEAQRRTAGSTFTPFQSNVRSQTPTGLQPAGQNTTPGGGNVPPNLQNVVPGLFNQAPPDPLQQTFRNALTGLLDRTQQPVTAQDASIQPAADAFRANRQRQAERFRARAAEQAAAGGTTGAGGFERLAQGFQSDADLDAANFESGLIQNEIGRRAQQLTQGLQLAQVTGDNQAARDLQTRLGLLQGALQQQGIDLQRELGTGDLSLRRDALGQQGRLGRLDALLRLFGMGLQNDQFNTSQGINLAQFQALFNQQNLLNLLGAL